MTAYTDFHYSPTGSGVISGAQVLEQTEQGINGLGQYVQDNVSGAIDTANQALTTAHNADSNATAAINLANSFNAQIIAANQTAGNALTTAQSAQNTANSASSLATTANNNAATALNTANAASSAVTTLTGTVNSLGNRMTTAENAINANAGNITTLQNNLATTNANVTAAANAASSAQATATSAQSTATLARNQAYVLRYTGTTITGGGTIAYADIDNTDNIKAGDKIIDISGAIYAIASVDTTNQTVTVGASPVINLFCDAENLIPAANDAYDLGSASKQWLNTYSKGYYYNGVAWGLDKDNSWSGIQFLSKDTIHVRNVEPGVAPASNITAGFRMENANALYAFCDVLGNVNTSGTTFVNITAGNKVKNGVLDPTGTPASHGLQIGTRSDGSGFIYIDCGWRNNLIPHSLESNLSLGTSTNKWKYINGINPGALSLPNPDNAGYDVVTSNWSTSFSQENDLLINDANPTYPGWLYIRIGNATSASDFIIVRYTGVDKKNITYFGSFIETALAFDLVCPIPANTAIKIWVSQIPAQCRYFPCLGNV